MFRTLIPSLLTAAALAAPASAQVYLAQSDLLVVQMESSGAPGDWLNSTSTPGFTGQSYIEWRGPNLFNSPGQGVFGFDFEVNAGGQWQLNMRNRHENPDATEENDVWVRMDGGPWVKTFSNMAGSVGAWTWESRFDISHNNQPQASYSLSPGQHRIEFSGRSFGFKIDSFHLFRPGASGALNASTPQSPVRFGEEYGNATANSTGQPSRMEATGSVRLADNNAILTATNLPVGVLGFFITSRTTGFAANPGGSSGNLLLGGTIGRFSQNITLTNPNGRAALRIDLTEIPMPNNTVGVNVGENWNFQFWHRDVNSQGATSNFSRGLTLTFE
jgi:hypothetical protein